MADVRKIAAENIFHKAYLGRHSLSELIGHIISFSLWKKMSYDVFVVFNSRITIQAFFSEFYNQMKLEKCYIQPSERVFLTQDFSEHKACYYALWVSKKV